MNGNTASAPSPLHPCASSWSKSQPPNVRGAQTALHAPLNLPDGAVITSLHAYFYDNSTQNLTARITVYYPGSSYSPAKHIRAGAAVDLLTTV